MRATRPCGAVDKVFERQPSSREFEPASTLETFFDQQLLYDELFVTHDNGFVMHDNLFVRHDNVFVMKYKFFVNSE